MAEEIKIRNNGAHSRAGSSGSDIYAAGRLEAGKETVEIDEKASPVDEQLHDEWSQDQFRIDKSLVIAKTEIMARQYNSLWASLLFLFVAFIFGIGQDMNSMLRTNYTTYATNSYKTHSLLSTIGVVNSVIGAGALVIYARLSDVFGRIRLFLSAMIFFIVGTVIQSQADNVQKYAAGAVLYNLGTAGMQVMMFIILSDFSSLKWRLLYTFVPTWPTIIDTWITGAIVDRLDPVKNWSWGIAMWAFIMPLSSVPFLCYLFVVRLKASKTEEWRALSHEKTYYQTNGFFKTANQLFWRLDVIGLIISVTIFGCILVPMTLAGGVSAKWRNADIIVPLVIGVCLIPVFTVWESKWARYPIAPFKMLKDRGIWSALAVSTLCKTLFYLAAGYLLTILMVAVNQSRGMASIITNLWGVVGCGFSPFFSMFVARVQKLKPFIILGCCLYMVSMGLLYNYRSGEHSKAGIIGGMVIWGLGSTMVTRTVVISSQSITSHEHLATITALNLAVGRIGGALGSAVSGAIWTQTLYDKLLELLGDPKIAKAVYQSPLTEIRKYRWGTPTREAIVEAYRYVQRYEVMVAMVLTVPLFILTFFLRDPTLTDEVADLNIKDGEYITTDRDDLILDWMKKTKKSISKRYK